jgi:hypothetical protein
MKLDRATLVLLITFEFAKLFLNYNSVVLNILTLVVWTRAYWILAPSRYLAVVRDSSAFRADRHLSRAFRSHVADSNPAAPSS